MSLVVSFKPIEERFPSASSEFSGGGHKRCVKQTYQGLAFFMAAVNQHAVYDANRSNDTDRSI
jgi:hypothetical protein